MTCRKQNRILMFDQLTESEQNQLLDHIETCAKCETYFDQYLLLEEGLDVLLMDEAIPLSANKKKSIPAILRPALLACASMFFIFLLIWNNDSVRAVIESTINEVIVEYLIKNMEPLEPENETSKTEKITYAKFQQPEGEVISYASGKHVRTQYENGDYIIYNDKYFATYSKKDNLFLIQEQNGENPMIDMFKDINSDAISYLGEKSYANRTVEVYLVKESKDFQSEYWFDKETRMLLKVVEITNGKRKENEFLKEFKVIEVEKDHKLFDFIAPAGAKIVDETIK